MIRTFVAVELEDDSRSAIAQLQASLKRELGQHGRDVRLQWVRPESMHLTLKFLGDVDETQILNILEALQIAGQDQPAFSLDVQGVGVFPDLRAPRVLWLGLSRSTDRLVSLASRVDTVLHPLGFEREVRPFTPHLTLARIKEGSREVGKALTETGITRQSHRIGTVPVKAIALMKSQLGSTGSVYTRLGEAPLSPNSP